MGQLSEIEQFDLKAQLRLLKKQKEKINFKNVRVREDLIEAYRTISENQEIKNYGNIVDTVLRTWVHQNFPEVAKETELKTPSEIL